MDKIVLLILVFVAGLYFVNGTGRLKLPPGRSTLWRYFGGYGYTLEVNYDDGNLNCGGIRTNGDLTTSCGVCGDPFSEPRKENSYINPLDTADRGLYVTGIPGYVFEQGRQVNFTVEVESGSRGWFKFQICNLPNANTEVTEGCFQDLSISLSNTGTVLPGNRYQLPDQNAGSSGMGHNVTVQLPASLTCNHCVVRWIWLIVNCQTYDCQDDDYSNLAAVTVVNCADMEILSSTNYNTRVTSFNFPKFNDPYASVHGEVHGGGQSHTMATQKTTTLKAGGLNSPPVITNLPFTTRTETTTTSPATSPKTKTTSSTTQLTTKSSTKSATAASTTTLKTGGLNSPPVITVPPTIPSTAVSALHLSTTTLKTGGMGGDSTTATTPLNLVTTSHHNWQTTLHHNWQTTLHHNWQTTAHHNWQTTSHHNWNSNKQSSNWFGNSKRISFIKLILFLSLLGFGRNFNQPATITWMPYYWQRNNQLTGYGYAIPRKQHYTGYGNTYKAVGNTIGNTYGYQKPYIGYGQVNRGKTYGNQRQTMYSNSILQRATNNYQQQNYNYQVSRNLPQIPNPSLSAHDVHKEFDVEPEVIKNEATALHNVEKISGGNPKQCENGMVLQCQTKKGVTSSGITEWICKACTQWTDDQSCPSDICDCRCIQNKENSSYNTAYNGKK